MFPGTPRLKALGSGGSGDVVLGRHDASGTLVAIKYLHRRLLTDPQWAQMFRGEAEVLASLDDLNIVRLYEYVESASGAAIVMELVDGVSLREILAHQGATTPEAALVVLQGSLLGLAAAHRRGVVHRDYKPENVLVNEEGVSKLTDFGIASRTGDRPVPAGTLMYAPPEQFAGAPVTPASDIYAATATFYECLTGRPPFEGDTAEALLYQHMSQPVPLDPVPEPLRPLVAAGMAKEPGDRPADGTTFVAALEAAASGAYGRDWEERGRSHLGEAALLLAALWPAGAPPASSRSIRTVWLVSRSWLRSARARSSGSASSGLGLRFGLRFVGLRFGFVVASGSGSASAPGSSSSSASASGSSSASGSLVGLGFGFLVGLGLGFEFLVGPIASGAHGCFAGERAHRGRYRGHDHRDRPGRGDRGQLRRRGRDHHRRLRDADHRDQPGGQGHRRHHRDHPVGDLGRHRRRPVHLRRPAPGGDRDLPASGPTTGGTAVTITGTGLAGATGVSFGGAAGTITADSGTQITVTSPAGRAPSTSP